MIPAAELAQMDNPAALKGVKTLTLRTPLPLSAGGALPGATIAYETYGTLNSARSNAVLVCHALTGDQFAASANPVTGRPPWWPRTIGPGKPIDTNRFFVIATNVLGGCMGSTGPASLGPDGRPWGLRFPQLGMRDMVRAQAMLMEELGLERLLCVIGGSLGGMQALQWAAEYPRRIAACVAIATAARHSAQNIAFYEVGRQAIMADPDWRGGDYLQAGVRPVKGLAVARMAAHVTYLSEPALKRKFDRALAGEADFGFDAEFQVETYLRRQGQSFTDRFDANSYLYITRAADRFDLAADFGGALANAFMDCPARFCVFSFSSDWHYPPAEGRAIARALIAANCEASYLEIETDKGHDAFLLEEPTYEQALAAFIDSVAAREGVAMEPA